MACAKPSGGDERMNMRELNLSPPVVTKTEFLLTISIQSQIDKWWEYRKISVDHHLISDQTLQTKIIGSVWQTVRRITKESMGVKQWNLFPARCFLSLAPGTGHGNSPLHLTVTDSQLWKETFKNQKQNSRLIRYCSFQTTRLFPLFVSEVSLTSSKEHFVHEI